MNWVVSLTMLLTGSVCGQAQDIPGFSFNEVERSACHIFIDAKYIWTVEVIMESEGAPIPVMNLLTFGSQRTALRPRQIHIYNEVSRKPNIERLAIDTGVDGDPYVTNFINVQPDAFIAFDLVGDFGGFEEPDRITVDLGEIEYNLEAIDCSDFEILVNRINQINFDSPDVRQDYDVLNIHHMGQKRPRRRGRR
jgi:hypothetical protein